MGRANARKLTDFGRCRSLRARWAVFVAHDDGSAADSDLGIAHRCGSWAMHADGKRAALRLVGAMEAPQPLHILLVRFIWLRRAHARPLRPLPRRNWTRTNDAIPMNVCVPKADLSSNAIQ